MMPLAHPSEPQVLDSALRVVEAGQRVVLDRVDLARLDLAQLVGRAVRNVALIGIGAVLIGGAWFTLMGGVVVWLQMRLPLAASLALVSAVSAIAGTVVLGVGVQRARTPLLPDQTEATGS